MPAQRPPQLALALWVSPARPVPGGLPLTLRISSLADGDMRTRSHQAGQRVFMYCFPWLESSLYG